MKSPEQAVEEWLQGIEQPIEEWEAAILPDTIRKAWQMYIDQQTDEKTKDNLQAALTKMLERL